MRREIVVARHLHREDAVRRDQIEKARHQALVIADPLQRGIGKHKVVGLGWRPGSDVGRDEIDAGMIAPRRVEHVGRGIEPGDRRLGPALAQQPGAVARAATEIDDPPRCREIEACEEVERRPRPLVGEAQVLRRIPTVHRSPRLRCIA
jgi:hypothetical protein